jgi:hypothetical protein
VRNKDEVKIEIKESVETKRKVKYNMKLEKIKNETWKIQLQGRVT